MKRKISKYLKEFALFFILIALFANIISYYRSGSLSNEKLDISYLNIVGKSSYDIKKDEPVLIHFWATWCPTCKLEAPNIGYLSKKYNVLTIAVKSGDESKINDYMKENDFYFSVLNDPEGRIAEKFGVQVFPTTIIYDKDKNMLFSEVGYTSTFGLWVRMILAEL